MDISGLAPDDIADLIAKRIAPLDRRQFVALTGPPASGKTTVAEVLAAKLGPSATVLPMDGFHLDNALLQARGLLPRKGAPETFDRAGFAHVLQRAKIEDELCYPTFDRGRDIAIAASGAMTADHDLILVEGNYLLLDEPGWRDLSALWDLSVFFDVALPVLEDRLVTRWTTHGLPPDEARARAFGNDVPNAKRVLDARLTADMTLSG